MWPDTPPTKFIIWGHPHYSHTHSYIHYAFHKAAGALGWAAEWLPNTAEAAASITNTDNYLFLTEGQAESHMPKVANAFYILHNCKGDLYSHIPEDQKLTIQVFTKDVYGRSMVPVKDNLFEFWQENANTLYMPWATDLLPEEINRNMVEGKSPRHMDRRALFLGTVLNYQYGNYEELRRFAEGCERISPPLPFDCDSSRCVDQEESIRQHQNALLTPAIVGRWQKEVGYIPCRIFKAISYGQLGVTNSKEAFDVIGGRGIYSADERELAALAVAAAEIDNDTLRLDAMKFVRDRHTYINRIDSLRTVFKMKMKDRPAPEPC